MEKINVAELLKDCPNGMELDCTIYEDVVFHDIVDRHYPIRVRRKQGGLINLNAYGCMDDKIDSKCVIFPKGKTTWEGFQRPFKDGDIAVSSLGGIHIMQNPTTSYCYLDRHGLLEKTKTTFVLVERLATEEEKEKLFDAIKANGYKWNAETKTLIRSAFQNFRKGDWVIDKQGLVHQIENVIENVTNHTFGYDIVGGGYFNDNSNVRLWTIKDAKDGDVLCTYECDEPKIVFILKGTPKKYYALSYHCYYNIMYPHFASDAEKGCLAPNDEDIKPATKEQRDLLFQKIKESGYEWTAETKTLEELPKFKVGDKFDINTLVPFESRVLVRDTKLQKWSPAIWGFYDSDSPDYQYKLVGVIARYCIPYENNEHLLGKTDDCDEFYRIWEKTGD